MINLSTVDLGVKKIKIPVAEISGKKYGKTLLVTAGMDGDENSGIEAAYRLIEEFKDRNFYGNLIVVPIVNIPGFELNTSFNPLDGKFPKNIYPGRKNGSFSERLIDWLDAKYIYRSDVWLDLHGGAHDEILEPFVMFFETEDKKINELLHKFIYSLNIPKIIFHKKGFWIKIDLLTKKGIVYIMTEVGFSGERNNEFIEKHIELTKSIMGTLRMINKKLKRQLQPRIYRKRIGLRAGSDGLWFPEKFNLIKKGQILGKIISLDNKEIEIIKAKNSGEFLWGKQNLFCKKGDILIEMGSELLN